MNIYSSYVAHWKRAKPSCIKACETESCVNADGQSRTKSEIEIVASGPRTCMWKLQMVLNTVDG